MLTKMLFYLDLLGNKFCQKILKLKNFKHKLCHKVVEAEMVEVKELRVEAEAIQKLPLPNPKYHGSIE